MRVGATFLLILIAWGSWGCSSRPSDDGHYATIKIYHTNDVHAHLMPDGERRGGFAYLSSVLKIIREQEPSALIFDAGDYYKKGSMPSQVSHDEATADILSLMPFYDARTVGNNEVKVGVTRLIEFSKVKEHAPLLSCNFQDKNGNPVFSPFQIFHRGGINIGVIGVTPHVPVETDVQPDPAKDSHGPYKIAEVDQTILPLIKKLRPTVDVLILLSHQPFLENTRLAKEHPEIDLIVSGHSHVLTGDQKKMGGNMVVEAGEFAHQLGVLTLVYDKQARQVSSLDSTFWPIGSELQVADKKVEQAIQEVYKKWAPDAFTRVGSLSGNLSLISKENPYEGSFHDWAADIFCAKSSCDLAAVNRDMFRESLKKGEVNKESVFLASPYDDKIVTVVLPKDRAVAAFRDSITDDFKKTGFVGWGFSKTSVRLVLDSDRQLTNVAIRPAVAKAKLKVALPLYVLNHCLDFFRAKYCPMPNPQNYGEVRSSLEERLVSDKRTDPPVSGRVRVIAEDETPEAINE